MHMAQCTVKHFFNFISFSPFGQTLGGQDWRTVPFLHRQAAERPELPGQLAGRGELHAGGFALQNGFRFHIPILRMNVAPRNAVAVSEV